MEITKTYTIKEFCEIINVSRTTLVRFEKSGKLVPNIGATGKKFYTEDHLKGYLGEV